MFGSFRLGSLFGITIRVHVLLLLLVLVLAFQGGFGAPEAIALALLGAVLLLHELGHCLVARRFGIRVVDITLWPLGGMARMSEMPESSKVEGLIAVAGPAVNFALALLAIPVLLVLLAGGTGNPGSAVHGGRALWVGIAAYFVEMNLVMGAFNLIPVFPTDGGRILRALFAVRGSWVVATERAVLVSRVIAVFLGAIGFVMGWWMLPFLALWLWWMGAQELAMVRARHAPHPFAGFATFEPAASKADSTRQDAPRGRSGFTQEDIERLEKFRGSLRHFERGP